MTNLRQFTVTWLLLGGVVVCVLFVAYLIAQDAVLGQPLVDHTPLLRRLLISYAVLAVVAIVVAGLLARRSARPIERLQHFTRSLSDGDRTEAPPMPTAELWAIATNLSTLEDELNERIETGARGRRNMDTILESMVEGLIAVDADHRVILTNRIARELLDIPPDQDMMSLTEATRNRDLLAGIREATRSGVAIAREFELTVRGETRKVQVHIAPLREEADAPGGAVAVIHDVTAVRRLETIRRDFVANVSHELKTPLTAIRAAAETLVDNPGMPPETSIKFTQKIIVNSDRLIDLINDILELSRLQSGTEFLDKVQHDFKSLVRESAHQLHERARAKDITLELELPEDSIRLQGDQRALKSVVENLVSNAITYTPQGGTVRVEVGVDGDEVILIVEDSGIGIEPHHLERIFERFYRVDGARARTQGGTGLGLAIVKNCVQVHHGRIDVDSMPGKGTRFEVRIPPA